MSDKKAFEGDDKYQSQKEVVPIGFGEKGLFAYEPYKRGGTEPENTMTMYWDTVRDLFFEKGNRWSTVLKQLKNMYSELTIGQMDDLENHIRYYLDQYKVQIDSKKHGVSLHDAIEFFIKHQDIIGVPGNIDSKTHTVEFSSGKKLSYDDVVKLYKEHIQKTSDYDGFFGSPKDLGKDPSGDFPSVSWLPKGNEDLDVNEDIRTANLKKVSSEESQKVISCPFCQQEDFDLIGLKNHLERYCDEYPKIETVEQERQRLHSQAEVETTPIEDLMEEHGILRRILLVFEAAFKSDKLDKVLIKEASKIIQEFIQGHHELLEEEFIFPTFKGHELASLIDLLIKQHLDGREAIKSVLSSDDDAKIRETLTKVIQTVREHASNEDTKVFPAFEKLVDPEEYKKLGLTFEQKEHEKFGVDGYQNILAQVETMEKKLNIQKEAASKADANAWVRQWIEDDELEDDPKIQEILKNTLDKKVAIDLMRKRVEEIVHEKGYKGWRLQTVESPDIKIDYDQLYNVMNKVLEHEWERKINIEWQSLKKQLETETNPEKRKQIEQRMSELEDMEFEGSKRENLKKKAETKVNEDAMKKAIEEYIPLIPERVWIETYGDYEAERYANQFKNMMQEHGKRVPLDISDVLEGYFEKLTLNDWIDMYHDEMRDHLIEEFYTIQSLEDLKEYYPGLIEIYQKYLQTKTALQNPLTNEQQNQVAAKYGTSMNTALMYYAEAIKNGHARDRALEYALEEMKKMNTIIDPVKLVEAIDVYIGK